MLLLKLKIFRSAITLKYESTQILAEFLDSYSSKNNTVFEIFCEHQNNQISTPFGRKKTYPNVLW